MPADPGMRLFTRIPRGSFEWSTAFSSGGPLRDSGLAAEFVARGGKDGSLRTEPRSMPPMKILHVIPSVGPARGGPSFAVRAIAGGLAARGVETHVVSTDDNGPSRLNVPLDRPVEENGVTYHYFPRQIRFYTCSVPLSSWLWHRIADFSVVHIHTVFSYASDVAAWIARRHGIPYIIRPLGVLNRWGFQNRRPVLKRLSFALIEKHLLSGAAAVQYTTRQERDEAAELGFAHRPAVIPNPVELAEPGTVARGQFRGEYPELAGRRVILFLSRIDRKKGLDLLIPAFRRVLEVFPTTRLVIAGDGDASVVEQARRSVIEAGMKDSVLWPGFLSGRRKLAALADADIFVLPSYSENFGIAPVEAMGLGLPVVVTDQVGIHQEISSEHAGLVTQASVEPLASALIALLQDEVLRSDLGKNALRLAASRYSVGTVLEQLMEMYCAVASHPMAYAH